MSKQNQALVAAVNDNLDAQRSDGTIAKILGDNGLDPSAANVGELQLIG